MLNPEMGKEQLHAENKMHLQTRVQVSEDPNLSRVDVDTLGIDGLDAWGTFRTACSLMDKHAADAQLAQETAEEITRLFTQLAGETQVLPREHESQKEFVAFLNNMLTMEQAVDMTFKYDPAEWTFLYKNLLGPIVELYK